MSNARRHVARMKNTGARLIVVFMQIPGRENHALTVSVDGLPQRLEQNVMQIVESREGQAATDLATVLDARMMNDGSLSILRYMHNNGYLQAVHVDQITMYPLPSHPYPLREVLEKMGRYIPEDNVRVPSYSADEDPFGVYEAPVEDLYEAFDVVDEDPVGNMYAAQQDPYAAQAYEAARAPRQQVPPPKYNPHLDNQRADVYERDTRIAQNLLRQAADLEAQTQALVSQAKAKREEAFAYAPHLRPAEPAPEVTRRPAPKPVVKDTVKAPVKATRPRKALEEAVVVEAPKASTKRAAPTRKASK